MTLSIRKATVSDAEVIAQLNGDVQTIHANAMPWIFKQPQPGNGVEQEFKKSLAEKEEIVFVAEMDGAPIGYVWCEHFRKGESARHVAHEMMYVHHLSVTPHARGKGVGTALLDEVKKECTKRGLTRLALDTWRFNTKAISFFERYGLEAFNQKMWMEV